MSKLKSKDLMIGDWVCFDGDTEHTNPVQIDGINTEEACVDGDWYDVWEPIPLTTEILEKNGFNNNGIPNNVASIEGIDWCDDTYVWSRQETPDERMFVSVYMDDPYNFFVEAYCQYCHADGIHVKYLHELQHTLKLCGIEKEIAL